MLSSVYCCGYFFRVCLECLAFQTAFLFLSLSRFRSRCFGSSAGFGGGGEDLFSSTRWILGFGWRLRRVLFLAFRLEPCSAWVSCSGHTFGALSCTPACLSSQFLHLSIYIFFTLACQQRYLPNLSLTTSDFIRVYMQKLGGWRVRICGCAERGLEVVPCSC